MKNWIYILTIIIISASVGYFLRASTEKPKVIYKEIPVPSQEAEPDTVTMLVYDYSSKDTIEALKAKISRMALPLLKQTTDIKTFIDSTKSIQYTSQKTFKLDRFSSVKLISKGSAPADLLGIDSVNIGYNKWYHSKYSKQNGKEAFLNASAGFILGVLTVVIIDGI